MALYECIFIARQDLSPAQVNDLLNTYKDVISSQQGTVSRTEYWGLKKMVYDIKKNARGHYVLMNIDATSAAVKEMERLMYINEDILRYLTLRMETLDEKPSVMMRVKTGRDYEREDQGRYHREDASPEVIVDDAPTV